MQTRHASSLSRLHRFVLLAALAGLLSACGEKEPIRVGFLGGMSGKHSNLGESGRNGVLMAIEE